MNAIEKLHALMVCDSVNIWHFPAKKEGPRFYYWACKAEPDNGEGHGFDSLEAMIDAAYARIDPLAKPLPESVTEPTQASAAFPSRPLS